MEKNTALEEIQWSKKAMRQAQERMDTAVNRARAAGASWAEIGKAHGITKQAAQQKYGKNVGQTIKESNAQSKTEHEKYHAEDKQKLAEYAAKAKAEHAEHVTETSKFLDAEAPAPEDEDGENYSYECICGWTIVYPEHDGGRAMQDVYEHEQMHQDQDAREEANKDPNKDANTPAQDALDQYGPSEATRRFYDRAQLLGLETHVSLRADSNQLSVFAKAHNDHERQVMVSQFPGKDGKGYRHYYSYISNAAGDWKKCSYAHAVQIMQTYAAI